MPQNLCQQSAIVDWYSCRCNVNLLGNHSTEYALTTRLRHYSQRTEAILELAQQLSSSNHALIAAPSNNVILHIPCH